MFDNAVRLGESATAPSLPSLALDFDYRQITVAVFGSWVRRMDLKRLPWVKTTSLSKNAHANLSMTRGEKELTRAGVAISSQWGTFARLNCFTRCSNT
jgi:hypothetical protein